MLNNYLKIALRHLFRNKSYTIINILGLAIGMACCLLILLFVKDELSYDKFHENGDRIHRMSLIRKYPGRERKYAIIPAGYGDVLKKEYPEIEEVCRMAFFGGTQLFKKGEEIFEEENYVWSDSTFFKVFDIPLILGDEKLLYLLLMELF